jgi:hypothetical protein
MNAVSASKASFAHARSTTRTRAICADYARYEAYKAEWRGRNPGATPSEYEAAMRAIAKACGV